MGLQTRFIPHAVRLLTQAGTDAWINQVESLTPDLGVSVIEESAGSETDREFTAFRAVEPTLALVTSDLAAIATVGMTGLLINSGSAKPGAVAYGRLLPLGGLPTAIGTSAHISMTTSDGLLVPMSMSASHNVVARLNMLLHAILGTDGTSGAYPMIFANSAAIASGAGQIANIYTTGPVKYTLSGGSSRLVQGIGNIMVNFGLQVFKESSDGEVYPTHISIISRMPTIEFTTRDATLSATIGEGISVSAFAGYFRAVSSNGQRIAPATTSHVSASGVAGVIKPGSVNLRHKAAGEAAYTFYPAKNSTLMTLSAAAAIPTS